MGLTDYLALPFAQHALIAGTLIAIICGMIGPFVIIRQMAFAVHGAAELSFTGAAAGLLIVVAVSIYASVVQVYLRTILYRFATGQSVPDLGVDLAAAFPAAPL